MDNIREKIVIVEADEASRTSLVSIMQSGGYEASAFSTAREGLDTLQHTGADLFLLDTDFCCTGTLSARETLATIRGSALTAGVRVIALVGSGADNRAVGLDLGADDAVSRPWDATELLARTRVQLRALRADKQLLEQMHIATEGQQIAHTAFDALAVTERMASNADSLDKRLKIGFAAVFALGFVYLWRRPQVLAPAGTAPVSDVPARTKPVKSAAVAGAATSVAPVASTPVPSSAGVIEEADRQVTGSLDELKDKLFRLELRRQAGTITDADYTRERARIEQLLRDLVRG